MSSTSANRPVLRVATLNIGSLFEPEWERRRFEILAWLDRLDADVVCLQEVFEDRSTPNTAGWLVEHAPPGRWHWVFGGFPFAYGSWTERAILFGSAILSRWAITESSTVALPLDPGRVAHGFSMQFELLHARTLGLDVFSTHLSAAPNEGYQRRHQVRAIDAEIRRRADASAPMPPILCGDFNAEPDSDEIRYLCSLTTIDGESTYYQEAWRAAGCTDPGYTNDHRTNPLIRMLNVPLKRIDYVFVGDAFRRPGGAGLVRHAELAFHEPLTGVVASDHYGVFAEIDWPQRPPG